MTLALASDFNGLTIASLTFSPTTIDISHSSASVVVTARATDALGVANSPLTT
jgi:hypothetical protein